MADPAGKNAATSTSRRKRALPTQEQARPDNKRSKLTTAHQTTIANLQLNQPTRNFKYIRQPKLPRDFTTRRYKHLNVHKSSTSGTSLRSFLEPSTSASNLRKSSKHLVASDTKTCGTNFLKKEKNITQDTTSSHLPEKTTIRQRSSSLGQLAEPAKSKHRDSKVLDTKSANTTEKRGSSSSSSSSSNSTSGNRKIDLAVSLHHKYKLRSRSSNTSTESASTNDKISTKNLSKEAKKRIPRELIALGADLILPTTEDKDTSSLTRSGAVLRRSTRTNKGSATTTGSCASSQAASGSGNNLRRVARQHKVGTVSVAALPGPPSSHSAATMATDHPEVAVSEDPPSPQEASQAFLPKAAPGQGVDSESDDSEVGRLQALLEARGLPPHLFGALGSRMQHLLHRSMGTNSSVIRAQSLIPGLQAKGDEGQQLQSVIEMCQLLVMGNEEILTGFPIKQVVPALIVLLGMEHNFDIMNHACRALTYMMEALPRSSAVVVDAVPVFLQKLQSIQCMDVAEQSLTALDMLSRRHSKSILHAGGVTACLTFLDFFSINAQRNALSITANCCLNLTSEEFHYIQDSIPLLASRLTQQDKKCVEYVCMAFSRLVDSYQQEPIRLQEIATTQLLTNMQQLLVITPPVINTNTFITVLRMLSVMCSNCSSLALILLEQNIAETLLYLLTGSVDLSSEIELVARQPQEQFEITALIGELMPKLPSHGLFTVDTLLERSVNAIKDQPVWQWRDDRGQWHSYNAIDNRIIETAHLNGDDDISLNALGRIYTIDFHSMQQINEDTGTTRPVQRRFAATVTNKENSEDTNTENASIIETDARVKCLREDGGLPFTFIRSLFSVLYEVYSSSAGPAVRFKCLRALLRMIYYASPDLLRDVLKSQTVSSHIAGMMASNDLRIVVGALQMAEILMNKLPNEFGTHFRREGVLYQIHRLADPEVPLGLSPPKSSMSPNFPPSLNQSQPSTSSYISSGLPQFANGSTTVEPPTEYISTTSTTPPYVATGAVVGPSNPLPSNSVSHVRLSDVLKRKRAAKRTTSRSKTRHEELPINSSLMQDLFTKTTTTTTTLNSNNSTNNSFKPRLTGSSSKTGFLQSLNPTKWGRSMNIGQDRSYSHKEIAHNFTKSSSSSHITAGNREKTRQWIRDQASKFLESHASSENDHDPAINVMTRLKLAIEKLASDKCADALLELRTIIIESDISPFEVNHSGLINALLHYLVDTDRSLRREQRLRIFLNVFANGPLNEHEVNPVDLNSAWMSALVSKLNGCVSHLEQFPLKVHDFPANSGVGRGSTSALKFFNTHQLKCNLQRHPECTNLKQWKGGTVKIDPLAMVQAIERYLIVRGYGRLRDKDSADSEEGETDEDIDDTLASVVISQTGGRHKIQFLIGANVLPYNMTVYQAVRQFSNASNDQSETDTDSEIPLGNAGIWVQTHVIYYRYLKEESGYTNSAGGSGNTVPLTRKGKGTSNKSTTRRKNDDLWNEGRTPPTKSPLIPFLTVQLPKTVSIQDSSLEVLCLLRIVNALNIYWNTLYTMIEYTPIVPPVEFLNNKLAAKACRQLQDPLVIMTGNLPEWLQQVASTCPFLFPFETRQLLFYVTSFDRDRALQRLLDMAPELSSNDTSERVTPRLDKRKRTISRVDILKQAEQIMQELASSKSLLEIQYENEVGTGLGPTLEFYTLVSKELQKTNLELWNSPNSQGEFIYSAMGLFPLPLSRNTKAGQVTKIRSKFRFLGKFIAKAVMDSRMLDLPFSKTFYRWLLAQEQCLSFSDLQYISPEIYKTIKEMHRLVQKRDTILEMSDLTPEQKIEQVERLNLDGASICDLDIDFILPGHNVELMKNGKNTLVTIHNLHLYCRLITHWMLHEGVSRQMESLREGFESVFPLKNLQLFQPEELEAIFCGNPHDTPVGWDVKTLMEHCRPDHGYTQNSKAIQYFYEILSTYNRDEQRQFVQFLTGSPRLPVGGFKALSPPLTVVRKTLETNMNPDDFLPSVMTCVNYLKLPDYSCVDVMRQKLRIAASEGLDSFYLS